MADVLENSLQRNRVCTRNAISGKWDYLPTCQGISRQNGLSSVRKANAPSSSSPHTCFYNAQTQESIFIIICLFLHIFRALSGTPTRLLITLVHLFWCLRLRLILFSYFSCLNFFNHNSFPPHYHTLHHLAVHRVWVYKSMSVILGEHVS